MAYLTVSIETLRAGDWVLTRDEHNPEGPLVLRRIEEVFENVAYQLQLVTLRSSNGQEHTITTTAEHRAYQLGAGWVAAGRFEPGDQIGEPCGASTVLACRSERHAEGVRVYNFRVNASHTYFVRENPHPLRPAASPPLNQISYHLSLVSG